jgi:UDP-GlcNAc:undecaprenyl-phosphate GlcNAc-1-phosphate transferase
MDGLCSGVLGIISVGFLVLATHMALTSPSQVNAVANEQRIVLSLAMFGAAVGFLPFNRSPATIFMGDAGSMLLGLNAAVLILLFATAGKMRWFVGALIVFGLPIADMALTLVRRWRNEKPLMMGDRSHFYDQLRDRGLSVRHVVAISYGVTILFVIFGCLVIFVRTMFAMAIYFGLMVVVTIVVGKLRMVSLERPSPGPKDRSADGDAA